MKSGAKPLPATKLCKISAAAPSHLHAVDELNSSTYSFPPTIDVEDTLVPSDKAEHMHV